MRVWLLVALCASTGCQTLLGPPPPELASSDDDPLTLAAEALERSDETGAAAHLEAHVRRHPDQPMFRAHLAELLWNLDRPADARVHFERFVADAQDATGPVRGHLVHCHTRLMEIARAADDPGAEAFHRGAGLLRLAEQPGAGEEVLCQAVKALAEARDRRPGDARPLAYLALAHERAGNPRAAAAARAAARNATSTEGLTAAERRGLALALGE